MLILTLCTTPAAAELRDDCGLEPPGAEIAPPPAKAGASRVSPGPVVRRMNRVTGNLSEGALSGKTIYVSPGHGWTWIAGGGYWTTQRGNTHNLVEDLISVEAVDEYLIGYLRNMGAHVVPLREADTNPNLVLVDDADPAVTVVGAELAAESESGWGHVPLPITGDTNPFTSGSARTMTPGLGGAVTFPVEIPESREYNVYVAYVQGPSRAPDARVDVVHAGGTTSYLVDQRRHGGTWVLLGRHYFHAGTPAEVVVHSSASGEVSFDAVRLGGGVALVDRGGGTNGRPMFEHCARYYAQWNGAPPDVWDYRDSDGDDDVVARSRFTGWDHEDGEDAVYVAWHTNAPDPGVGTSSYTYGPSPPPGPLSEFSGVPGSLELQDLIHDEIVGDLRLVWDADWPDRGQHTAYFGEVNPSHNPEIPAVLIEVAFHSTLSDADQLREPAFRRVVTRSIAHAIARYFAQRDGLALTLPPEPPIALRVENDGAGLRVSWRPPADDPAGGDAPSGYRVYLSRDGLGFDDGTDVQGESFSIPLAPGDVRYARVTAVNAGGESMPTEVVGARVGAAPLLIVGAFDRLDAYQSPIDDLPGLGLVDRMRLERMNDGSYAARHGAAVAAFGASFDGATDEAVELGDVDLAPYVAVDWFLGEESYGDDPINAAARAAIGAYVAAGGRMFVSGSEVGWAMDWLGSDEERAFYNDVLRAIYVGDDAETWDVVGVEGPYGGVATVHFGDPSPGSYDAEWPDQLDPGAGGAVALDYAGGSGGHAAVTFRDGDARGVVFGFPFETIAGAERRAEVMARTLTFLEIEPEDFPDAGTGDGGSGFEAEGSCGCRAGGRSGSVGSALLLLAWLGFARRRRA